jgi:peptidoglycan/xylan/chitin deacetylase (PgdA/CDA1 family)/2-polyprenyl-3-methyl-5-hydroxy-6-metoxy-1,4-benzoquinol methylase
MICPLAPAHLAGLTAFQLFALLLFLNPALAPAPLLLFVLVCLFAPMFPGFSFFLPITTHGRRDLQAVALTIDDGPDPAFTPQVLELLGRHGVQATFFMIGAKAEAHPQLVEAILASGHTIGNHSQHHHPFLMLMGKRRLRQEIEAAQAVFRSFGIVPLAFRPPVGITSPALWRILLELGMNCVNFSCRAADLGNRRCANLAARLLGKVRPGDIVLLHDVSPRDGQAVALLAEFDTFLTGLKARNLEVQPLARIIGKEVMQTTSASTGAGPAARFYDGLADTYDHEQFSTGVSISRRREQALFEARLGSLFGPDDRVLEIGAGTGIFTLAIARQCREVVAVDISARMLQHLEAKAKEAGLGNIQPRLGAVEALELEGPFTIVCAFSALEYVSDLPGLMLRLGPLVAPGGSVYFLTARRSLFRLFTQIGNAMRQGMWLKARSRREMQKLLKAAGFEPVSITPHLLRCGISGGMLLEVVARKR